MPKKIRELVEELQKNGFADRGGKGSHRNFMHPQGIKITLSGKSGDDAKPYQEKDVKLALSKVAR
ncbi:type II toxin-antitoxin system HicA family toxin [Candidatus Electronema sp. TJ]|uniref:type II toxin-antitoxin system HicA family toxin n=1 Tax=Candidatus Electronema sp. TJ TaxID=3401573 RepID=UPI003AA91733